jgi:hypothetical protein
MRLVGFAVGAWVWSCLFRRECLLSQAAIRISLTALFYIAGGSGSTLLPTTHAPIPGAAKWSAVRSKNGTASLQDFVVSIDAATPGFAKSGTAPPPAPAPGKEVAAPGKQLIACVFTAFYFEVARWER